MEKNPLSPWLTGRRVHLAAIALIAIATAVAYHNSFSGPFVFDDEWSIEKNPTIRSLWPIWPVITPLAGGDTVSGRPILNLSFAINYAIGGGSVFGYHLTNLMLHILAGAMLYAFLLVMFRSPALREKFAAPSLPLAFFATLLWALHPIQTESVTYIVQRAESLASLFYLLTLFLFALGIERGKTWLWFSVAACAIGMGCKEIVASVPIMALLYDRTFVSGTFREAFRQRWSIYAAMASTWLLLAYFILATGNRGATAGLNLTITSYEYFTTQCVAILEYLRLSFWPHPLIFDYGRRIVSSTMEFLLPALILTGLGVASVVALARRSVYGFLGVWFFAMLAPTSSFVPVVTQTMATHRMYLALAAVICTALLLAYSRFGRKTFFACPVIALVLALLTLDRNTDYRSIGSIWGDTVMKNPTNKRALVNLSIFLVNSGKYSDAFTLAKEASRIDPDDHRALTVLGMALAGMGQQKEALAYYRQALVAQPTNGAYHRNLGIALLGAGTRDEAGGFLQEAIRIDPTDFAARNALQTITAGRTNQAGSLPEAGMSELAR
jgi:tetratricopeptide (TPR) repeat protein